MWIPSDQILAAFLANTLGCSMHVKLKSAVIAICVVSGCGEEKIDGFCFNSADEWASFLRQYQYTEISDASIEEGRTVILYHSSLPPQDFMVGVQDPNQKRWCVQFTKPDMSGVVDWLLQHYDPAIVHE